MSPVKKKELSGGMRAANKKRALQVELRGEGYDETERREFAALGEFPADSAGAGAMAVAYLRVALKRAAVDPGVEPHARREQVARFAAMLSKASLPEARVEEAVAVARDLTAEIETVKHRRAVRATPNVPRNDPAGAVALPPH